MPRNLVIVRRLLQAEKQSLPNEYNRGVMQRHGAQCDMGLRRVVLRDIGGIISDKPGLTTNG
jgi:hypothetical protein